MNVKLIFTLIKKLKKNCVKTLLFLTIVFAFFLFLSCQDSGSFNLHLISNSDEYKSRDSIILDLHFSNTTNDKLYLELKRGLKNIELSMAFEVPYKLKNGKMTTVSTKEGIHITDNKEIINLDANKIEVKPQSTHKLKFKGYITETEDQYLITFDSYPKEFKLDKINYLEANNLSFHAYYIPLNAPIGYSFEDFAQSNAIVLK